MSDETLPRRRPGGLGRGLSSLLGEVAQEAPLSGSAPRGALRSIPVSSIDYITASGSYAEIHLGPHRHLLRQPIQTLEEQLDPARFLLRRQ